MPAFKLTTIYNNYMCHPIIHGYHHEEKKKKILELSIWLHSSTLTENEHVTYAETRWGKNEWSSM
jgi:hypothetical protein